MRSDWAEWRPINATSLPHRAPITKLCVHTTEGSTLAGAWYTLNDRRVPSHYLYDPKIDEAWQLVDTFEAAHSLWHVDQSGVIQIEVVGFARLVPTYNDIWYQNLARVIADICEEHHISITFRQDWPATANEGYGRSTLHRLTFDEWDAFQGILGHCHAPSKWWTPRTNTHWDPGGLDVDRLARYITDYIAGDGVDIINDTENQRMWAEWSVDGNTTLREYGTYRGASVGKPLPGIAHIVDEQPSIRTVDSAGRPT